MMQTAGPNELGYANTALILALFDVLASKGILTPSDVETVVTNAVAVLEPTRNIRSVDGAIHFMNSLLPQIGKSSSK
jgi:hypothetical protein